MNDKLLDLDRKGLRNFGLTTGGIIVCLFGLLLPWIFEGSFPYWPWILAGILWLWALLLPATLRPVYRAWMKFGHVLGKFNTRIILGIVFYILVMPTGIIMRLFGKDPMARKLDKQLTSYRVQSTRQTKNHMERPF